MPKNKQGTTLTTELVGIKNLKTTGNYRLEFDVYEIDTSKVKELIDKPSKETPAFAKAKRGIIPKATYGLIACSILINKEKSFSFFL